MTTKNHISTRLIQSGYDSDTYHRGINPPIVRTSTVTFRDADHFLVEDRDTKSGRPIDYGIQGIEPMNSAITIFKELENAQHAFVVESGLLSITTPISALIKSGDHILALDNVYGSGRRYIDTILTQQFNISVDYFSPDASIDDVEKMIKPNTTIMLLETPGSLTFEMADLDALYGVCKRHNITSIVDNTWASGYYYNPLDHGADISAIACTKYVGGGSDILNGVITCNDDTLAQKIALYIKCMGLFVSPDDLYLALRGIRSMTTRMDAQFKNTLTIVDKLSQHPLVKNIYYPPMAGDKYHDIWKKTFTGGASLFGVEFNLSHDDIKTVNNALNLFKIGDSWGGYESLAKIIVLDETRIQRRFTDAGPMLRFYIGLDNPDDLIADIEQALATVQ